MRNELVLDARLMREAPSDAIRHTQTQSDALRWGTSSCSIQRLCRRRELLEILISGNQWQSVAISGNQRRNHLCRRRELLEILLRRRGVHTQRPSVAVSGAISVIISGNQ